jgi:XXXCH domain-containing protein
MGIDFVALLTDKIGIYISLFTKEACMASKLKHNWLLSRAEAADLLRKLADTLEQESDDLSEYGISLAELVKFKVKVDLGQDDALEVKFTGKGLKVCGAEDPCGSGVVCESYSKLKKRMQIYFKAMRESIANGEMPSREIVSVFLSDSERMISYHGYGDEYYPAYAEICERLRLAFDQEDQAATAAVVEELTQSKKSCHDRYK